MGGLLAGSDRSYRIALPALTVGTGSAAVDRRLYFVYFAQTSPDPSPYRATISREAEASHATHAVSEHAAYSNSARWTKKWIKGTGYDPGPTRLEYGL